MEVKLPVSLNNVNKCPYCGILPNWKDMKLDCGLVARPVDEFTIDVITKCSKSETLLAEYSGAPVEAQCICSIDQIMRTGCTCGGK